MSRFGICGRELALTEKFHQPQTLLGFCLTFTFVWLAQVFTLRGQHFLSLSLFDHTAFFLRLPQTVSSQADTAWAKGGVEP
jgi:hypothetical protein